MRTRCFGILDIFSLDHTLESTFQFTSRLDDYTRAIQHSHTFLEDYFLYFLRPPGSRSYAAGFRSFESIDQGRFSDVRVTDETDSERSLDGRCRSRRTGRVVSETLDQFEERFSGGTRGGLRSRGGRSGEMVALLLGRGLERDCRSL